MTKTTTHARTHAETLCSRGLHKEMTVANPRSVFYGSSSSALPRSQAATTQTITRLGFSSSRPRSAVDRTCYVRYRYFLWHHGHLVLTPLNVSTGLGLVFIEVLTAVERQRCSWPSITTRLVRARTGDCGEHGDLEIVSPRTSWKSKTAKTIAETQVSQTHSSSIRQ